MQIVTVSGQNTIDLEMKYQVYVSIQLATRGRFREIWDMFLVGFIGMLLCVGVHTEQVEGQVLLPECSNPQGIYVAEEGSSVKVCFTLYRDENANLPQMVTLSAESRSDQGVVATSNIDYKSENLSRRVEFNGRDLLRLCQTTNITNDAVAERTEYFTVTLHGSLIGRELASCQVAIIDRNGGPSDCYEEAVANVSLGQIINDRAFCFMNDLLNGQCQQELESDRNATSIDCTRWNQRTFNSDNLAAEIITDQILPNIVAADSECVQNVISGMKSLYRAETGGPTPPPPREECATNCVLTVTNNKNCETSVLLLEQVFREEAIDFLNDLSDVQTELCTVGLKCCESSQTLPPICQDSDPETMLVTGIVISGGQVGETVLIGAVLGGVFGVVLMGGAVVLIVLVMTCLIVYLSRRKQKASFVNVENGSANSRAVVYKRQATDAESNGSVGDLVATPLVNPNYTNENPPDYEIVVSTDLGNVSTYPRWRRRFAGMIVNLTDLQYGGMIGEGAFGKVFQGTLKTSIPGQGSNGTTQRDVAVKTLKKASKPEEIEDFIAESAIMLDFNHPNVLRLVGVCFDTEDKLPLIVLPYMANGDLRSFLKSKRSNSSSTSDETMPEGLSEAVLLGMCMDIAFGMAYLANCKFVHRDLAARNCMVDSKLSVKVADFGLSRDVYHSDYYRLTHKQRLPVRWMPPESIFDSLYNEKSDVWSYGAVCWEVFKLGRKPYPGLDNAEIPDYISKGSRLSKPCLCPDRLYDLMRQTWREDPKERPTFNQIVDYLAKMTGGQQTRQPLEEHEYHSVEGLIEGEEEEDVGGVNIYTEVESPLYKNFPTRPDIVVPPPVPEEYEVPIRAATSRSVELNDNQELVIPTEYEVPVSSLPRSGGQKQTTSPSTNIKEQQLEDSIQGHVYHTLEAPTNK